MQVADAAQILRCYGCGVGRQLQLQYNPWPGNFNVLGVRPQKEKKQKKKKKEKKLTEIIIVLIKLVISYLEY